MRRFDKNWVIIGAIIVLVLPFLALLIALYFFRKNIFDNSDFWYGYMAYFGSVILATVAMYQTQKSNKLSEKFDEMNALQNYSLAKATKQCEFMISHHDDSTITWSAPHKKDSGAIMLLERGSTSPTIPLNEYLLEFKFKDFSKAAIRIFEEKQIICVQEPPKDVMYMVPEGNNTIPVGFEELSSKITSPIWTEDDIFKIYLKIYAPMNGVLAHVIENSVPFCLMMQVKLHSVCGVQTVMEYKYWFAKNGGNYEVVSHESLLIDISQESSGMKSMGN